MDRDIPMAGMHFTQGSLELEIRLLEASERPLKAPVKGDMIRTIHESASCRAFYRLRQKGCTLFAFETDRASFEFEYRVKNKCSGRKVWSFFRNNGFVWKLLSYPTET